MARKDKARKRSEKKKTAPGEMTQRLREAHRDQTKEELKDPKSGGLVKQPSVVRCLSNGECRAWVAVGQSGGLCAGARSAEVLFRAEHLNHGKHRAHNCSVPRVRAP